MTDCLVKVHPDQRLPWSKCTPKTTWIRLTWSKSTPKTTWIRLPWSNSKSTLVKGQTHVKKRRKKYGWNTTWTFLPWRKLILLHWWNTTMTHIMRWKTILEKSRPDEKTLIKDSLSTCRKTRSRMHPTLSNTLLKRGQVLGLNDPWRTVPSIFLPLGTKWTHQTWKTHERLGMLADFYTTRKFRLSAAYVCVMQTRLKDTKQE